MDSYPPMHPSDYPHSSGLSEADSLSDSDWLDISSNKESEDNDSVSSSASDQDEIDYRAVSRRSSMSLGSSRDGEVEAWEGFAEDDSEDEQAGPVHHDDLIGISIPPTLPPALRTLSAASPLRDITETSVGDATILNQSMAGTLSASRSSSGGHASTAHNSTRDLRLSFPDPLTSSRDELHVPYEDISPSEQSTDSEVAPPTAKQALDQGSNDTPGVLRIVAGARIKADLEIVLYGTPTSIRWSVVDKILEKAANGGDLTLLSPLKTSEGSSQLVRLNGERDSILSFPKVVNIIDRTVDPIHNESPEKHDPLSQGSRPSLAIIFIPSTRSTPTLADGHSSYLPILIGDDHLKYLPVETAWPAPGFTKEDALFYVKSGHFINSNVVDSMEASRVHDALQVVMTVVADFTEEEPQHKTRQITKDREHVFMRFGVTGGFITIVMILLAQFYLPEAQQLPTPASKTPHSNIGPGRIIPIVNKSSSVAASNTAIVPSSFKDFALAVFNPTPLSASPSSSASSTKLKQATETLGSDSKKQQCSDGKLMSWSERVKSSKDLIISGQSSLSLEARSKKALSLITSKTATMPAEKVTSSLSIRLVDSLSHIFDVKALTEVVRHDIKDLSEAIDELMIAIGKQTSVIMHDTTGTGKVLRKRLEQRHGKAKARAQRLKNIGGELGEQLLSFVGGELKSRADQAKGKAREMAESIISSDAWTAHTQRVEAHRKRMEATSNDRQVRRESRRIRREGRRHRRDAKKEGGLFSRS